MPNNLHAVFGALSDPTRMAIVERLIREGETSAGDLAQPFAMSKPAISRHLRVLEDSGLVAKRINRQFRMFSIQRAAVNEIGDWIEEQRKFWNASFDRLEAVLEQSETKQK
ncbi:MAG: metalloregulator ArsR/SmtB family transcription factor [Pseudomonadota bacterium]